MSNKLDSEQMNEYLTPSAKNTLQDILLETQDKIINNAIEIADKKGTAGREISLSDILEAKEQLFSARNLAVAYSKRLRMLSILSLTAIIYSAIGVFFYIYKNKYLLSADNSGLIISGVGITMSICTTLITILTNSVLSRQNDQSDIKSPSDKIAKYDDMAIIKRWQIIEDLSSKLMLSKGYPPQQTKSVRPILDFLSHEFHDRSNIESLRQLLTIRNQIVHEGRELSDNERKHYLTISNNIINALESVNS